MIIKYIDNRGDKSEKKKQYFFLLSYFTALLSDISKLLKIPSVNLTISKDEKRNDFSPVKKIIIIICDPCLL